MTFCLLLVNLFNCVAADTTINNKCSYYSRFSLRAYNEKIEQVCTKLTQRSDTVYAIGYRSFNKCKIVFIAGSKKHCEGFVYDFGKGNFLSRIQNKMSIEKLFTLITKNFDELTTNKEWPKQHISHDFSLTIRFLRRKEQFQREICYSQLLAMKNQPIGRTLTYFLDTLR